jgi:predicted enzyme related to lactoylglutathione lyase
MSERDGYQPGVPCWVDTWQPDPWRAARFYAGLFGWVIEDSKTPAGFGPYYLCKLRGREVAAIRPSPRAGVQIAPAWITHIWVESVAETVRKTTEAGGRVLIQPTEAFDGGRMAILADPVGAVFGVWQPGGHRGAQLINEPGAWTWSGLQSRDPEGCKGFYSAVFGWDADGFGTAGDEVVMWHVRGYAGGQPEQPVARDVVAGMAPMTSDRFPDEAGSRWEVDFWVKDADAIAGRAAELGGTVVTAPFDTSVGRSAVLADPQGAEFSVSRIGPSAE